MSAADVLGDLVAFHRDDVDPVARCSKADPRREEDRGREGCSRLGHRPSQKEQR